MLYPWAARKVLAIPPPMIRVSTFCSRLRRTPILSETLAPLIMATKGRCGAVRGLLPNMAISFSMSKPGIGGEVIGDAHGAGVSAVGSAKGVVDENVG